MGSPPRGWCGLAEPMPRPAGNAPVSSSGLQGVDGETAEQSPYRVVPRCHDGGHPPERFVSVPAKVVVSYTSV